MNQGRDLSRLCRDLVEHFRNLLVARLSASRGGAARVGGADMAQLLDLPDQEIADLIRQSSHVSVESLLDYLDFIAAGDEEVARSATPRFALEAVLIRLASLPQSLPVAEILTRLERLEGRVSGEVRSPVAAERPKSVSIAAPVMKQGVTPALETVPAAGDDASKWREFVAFVGKEKKFLASHLGTSAALSLPPAPLKVSVAERHHLGYLNDADNLASLRELAKRFFAVDVPIQFVNAAVDAAPLASSDAARTEAAAEDRSEMVKEALRIFGGSVRSVRRENP